MSSVFGWLTFIAWLCTIVIYDEIHRDDGNRWIVLAAAVIAVAFSGAWLIAAIMAP